MRFAALDRRPRASAPRLLDRASRHPAKGVCWAALLLLLPAQLAAAAPPQTAEIELDTPFFDWVDVVEDMATFEWSVDVVNNGPVPRRVRVILDVLDDDDRVVNRDDNGNPNDAVIITVESGQTVPVKQQGGLSYDLAAEVVTYRHRWELIEGDS